ncbi:MAG: hypothetical protein ACOC41_01910 [Chitinivibrionales bacterium]
MEKTWVLILSLLFLPVKATDSCPYSDGWDTKSKREKQTLLAIKDPSRLTTRCFVSFLGRLAQSKGEESSGGIGVLEAIDTYAQAKSFDVALLFSLASHQDIVEEVSDVQIRQLWRSHNGGFRESITTLTDRGMYQQLDSLYQAMDSFNLLDIYDVLGWTKIKGVIGDFHGLGKLVCKVAVEDERLVPIAQNHMHSQLNDAERHEVYLTLQTYQDCYLGTNPPDSTDFGLWLADQYERYGFFRKQLIVLTRIVPNGVRAGRQLLMAAQKRFSDGMYGFARDAAKAACARMPDQKFQRQCASLIYRAYDALDNTDSALVWMKRADLEDPQVKMAAISIYQKAGSYGQADSLIALLPQSLEKDTLSLRQYIFQGQVKEARDAVTDLVKKERWKAHACEALLWQVRLEAFVGHADKIPSLIDSASFSPADRQAGEILRLKYEALKLSSYPQAVQTWSNLLTKVFVGRPGEAVSSFSVESFPADIQQLLTTRLLDALVKRRQWRFAGELVKRVNITSPGAQMQYLTALVQYHTGEKARAQKTLEELVLEHPGDVFAEKARMYLLEISGNE